MITLPKTNKPQAIMARAFIQALHARKRGEISEKEKGAVGNALNATISAFGKP